MKTKNGNKETASKSATPRINNDVCLVVEVHDGALSPTERKAAEKKLNEYWRIY